MTAGTGDGEKAWKTVDWGDECPVCEIAYGSGVEVFTDCRDNDAFEGDKARCKECHLEGVVLVGSDERAHINWREVPSGKPQPQVAPIGQDLNQNVELYRDAVGRKEQGAPTRDTYGYEHTWHLIFQTCLDLGMSCESDIATSGEQLVVKFIRGLMDKVNSKPADYRMPFSCQKDHCDILTVIKDDALVNGMVNNVHKPYQGHWRDAIDAYCAALVERITKENTNG